MKSTLTRLFVLLFTVIISASVSAQVSVSATAGTASASYSTLSAAFGAINAGTHQGDITISITASTTEPANTSDTLYSSGSLSASYTSVYIKPTTDGVTISGSPVTGHGVIELFGADNVTIDGDNPNSGGTNRDLTITNTTASATANCSVVRLTNSLANANLASCDNVTVKNCIINGNVTAGNNSTITSTTSSSGQSWGIVAGGDTSSLALALTKLAQITSSSPTMSSPTGGITPTTNNLVINNNQINFVARGIAFHGNSAGSTSANSVTITNNVIGSSTSIASLTPPVTNAQLAGTVYVKGIIVQNCNSFSISGNSIQNITSYVGTTISAVEIPGLTSATGTAEISGNTLTNIYLSQSTNAVRGIQVTSTGTPIRVYNNSISNIQSVASNSVSGINMASTAANSSAVKNSITKVYCRSTTASSQAVGILISTGSDTFANNTISDILSTMNTSSFTTSQGAYGIMATSGTGGKVYHNSINLAGTLLGTSTNSHISAAFAITTTSCTGWDVRNNIFANNITGGGTALAHVSVYLPSSATASMNLTLNNNAYYCGATTASQGIAQVGTTSGTGFYLPANFSTGPAAPGSTNFRVYTSALLGAGINDNASFASSGSVPFTSSTDLHISSSVATSPSQLESGGAATSATGVTTDIDGTSRPNGLAPDMGADEFTGTVLDLISPTISYTAVGFDCDPTNTSSRTITGINISDISGVPTSGSFMPRMYYRKGANGSYSSVAGTLTSGNGTNGTWSFIINYTGLGLTNGDSVYYFVVAQDNASTPNVGTMPAGGVFSDVNTVSSYSSVINFFRTATLSGSYNVGAGFTAPGFSTLSAAIKAYNNSCLGGPVTFNLISTSYSTTSDTILANSTASATNTLTIKPTLANTTITGTSGVKNGALVLYGADYVTINGSIGSTANSICNGTRASRDLTIVNTTLSSVNTAAVIWLCNTPAGDPATNNKVINCNITGSYNSGFGVSTQVGIGCAGPGTGGAGELITSNGLNANWGNGNINNQYINDSISICSVAIYTAGANSSNKNTGTVISMNTTAKSPNNIYRGGISANFEDGISITGNTINAINAVNANYPNAVYGIALGYGPGNTSILTSQLSGNEVSNATVTKNVVDSVLPNTSAGGSAIVGMYLANSSTGTTTISNNRISNFTAFASFGNGTDVTSALHICGGVGTVNVYNNTINLVNGTTVATGFTGVEATYGFSIANNSPVVNFKNNIINASAAVLTNRNRAIGLGYALPATNLTSNNNSLYASVGTGASASTNAAAIAQVNSLLNASGTTYSSLSGWQAASGQDASSVSVIPVFTGSSNNLHIDVSNSANCSLKGAGASGLSSDDVDCTTRGSNDIGADEFSPSVTISSATTSVCAGNNTSFSATVTNSTNNSYQWKKNGNNVGTNSATYSDAGLASGDIISCVITNNDATSCIANATSNSITMTVNSSVTPLVSISTASTTVCNSNNVSFNATGTNAGSSPVYQWKNNNVNVGSGSSITFTPGTLSSGNVISCILTANNTCQTSSTANSNTITLTVNPAPSIGTSTIASSTMCTINGTTNVYNSNTQGGGVWSSSNSGIASVSTVNGASGVVTATGNGTATLTYSKTASNSCVSTASVSVTVAAVSTPNSITGTNSICKGSTTQLNSTTSNGTWSSMNNYATVNSTGLVSGASAGAAVIRYTLSNANGCSAYASYNITVNAIPNVPSIAYASGTSNPQYGTGGGFCNNKTFTVTGSPAGGTWISSNTGRLTVTNPGGVVNTIGLGAVTLTYTITNNGCSNSRTITGTVVTCASRGVNGNNVSTTPEMKYTMYPNPAHNTVNFTVDMLEGSGQIIITNLIGKQVKTQALSLGNNTMDISGLAKGFYLVNIVTNGTKKTEKLIVE